MKKLLASGIFCFLSLSATLMAETPLEHAKHKMAGLDLLLSTYEMEGSQHQCDFNFHVGYITGQRRAYYDMIQAITLLKD